VRILTGTLAVIGGFFCVLQILWFAKLDGAWLPYAAHGFGAFLAGAAMVRASPSYSLRESFVAGAIAIAALAVITWTLPNVFVLTAAQIDHADIILPIVIAGSGAASAGATWLFRSEAATTLWVGVLAAMIAPCALQLGVRFAMVAGVPLTTTAITIAMGVLAVGAGARRKQWSRSTA
jgi:hypothetical protein